MARRRTWSLVSEYREALERERTRVAELEARVSELEHELDERRRHFPPPRLRQVDLPLPFAVEGIRGVRHA